MIHIFTFTNDVSAGFNGFALYYVYPLYVHTSTNSSIDTVSLKIHTNYWMRNTDKILLLAVYGGEGGSLFD